MKLHKGLLAAVAVVMGSGASASAATFQIGSFESAEGLYSYSAGLLTGTTTGSFTVDPEGFAALTGLPAPADPILSTLTVNASATGNAFVAGPSGLQQMSGYIEVTRNTDDALLLRADFTGGFFGGLLGGNTANLAVVSPIGGATVVYTSDFFDGSTLVDPKAVTFALNPISNNLAIVGNNFAAFTAPDTANFSASIDVVPEPLSTVLLGIGLLGAGIAARRRR